MNETAKTNKTNETSDETSETDERWMREALIEAQLAGDAGDVPVGSVIVIDGVLVARGHNQRQQRGDPTAHAEIEALRAASQVVGNWRIEGTLYVTQEPCPMCAGALVNARVKRVVYGCANPKAGAATSLFSILTDERLNHRAEVQGNVLSDDCADLLRAFFAALRRK